MAGENDADDAMLRAIHLEDIKDSMLKAMETEEETGYKINTYGKFDHLDD